MKTIKISFFTLIISLLIFSSCDKNIDQLTYERIQEDLRKFDEEERLRPRIITAAERLLFNHNLDLADRNKKNSYFNTNSNSIKIQVPLPSEDFHYFATYNVSSSTRKAMLVIVDNAKRDSVCNSTPMNYMLETPLEVRNIGRTTTLLRRLKLEKNDSITVFVFSDNIDDLGKTRLERILEIHKIRRSYEKYVRDDSIIFGCGNLPPELKGNAFLVPVRPRESGGGVIIEGP